MHVEDILYEKREGVARITINRPKVLNAFRSRTLEDLAAAFEDVETDGSVGVAVLTGAGDRAFCAGGDIAEMRELTPATGRVFLQKVMRLAMLIRGTGKPIIAAVRGYCLGGGNELNLLCDLTVAAEDAQFGQVGPTVGSVPVMAGTQMLPRLLGEKRAREVVFLCQRYGARDAERMGWVNKVVPAGKLDDEIAAWCRRILELSPQALRIAKLSFNFESDLLYPSYAHGLELLASVYATDEFREGMSAFLGKRKADFSRFRR